MKLEYLAPLHLEYEFVIMKPWYPLLILVLSTMFSHFHGCSLRFFCTHEETLDFYLIKRNFILIKPLVFTMHVMYFTLAFVSLSQQQKIIQNKSYI